MHDHAVQSFAVTALRIGRTDIGATRATIDDDALSFVVAADGADHPTRVRLSTVDRVHWTGDELEIIVRDGTRVSIVTDAGAALETEVLGRCRAIPELTRTLRALGSSRGQRGRRASAPADQRRFFAPLLLARRDAMSASGAGVIAAFDGRALAAAFEETVRGFAADRHLQPGPARRALEAELYDLTEPLLDALRRLTASGTAANESADDIARWREWSAELKAAFELADRVWVALDAALDATAAAR